MRDLVDSTLAEKSGRWPRVALGLWAAVLVSLALWAGLHPTAKQLNSLWREVGQSWIDGEDLYTPTHGGFRYGPLFAACFSALAVVPFSVAAAVVRLVNGIALLGATLAWLRRAAPERLAPKPQALFLGLLAILSISNLESGQFNPLVIGLLLGSVVAVHERRWNFATALLALASVLKVYPLAFALLLVVVYPRQLIVRLPLALIAVVGLPFLVQNPEYVARQYRQWGALLSIADEHRRFQPLDSTETYRDAFYLFRLFNVPMPLAGYAILQAVSGLAAAVACRLASRRGAPASQVLWIVLVLGTCWMTLLGPASEPKTYILVAPALAWWAIRTCYRGPRLSAWLASQACGLQLLCFISSFSPHSVTFFRSAGLHPISALLLLASCLPAWRQMWSQAGQRAASASTLDVEAPRVAKAA
jgi:glycosyl transferase family 87